VSSPTRIVEIAFGYGPLETAPVWTNVTADVRHSPPMNIVRGRTSERSAFSAGTATLTLSNRDRKYDPTYSSGTYFGDLKPGVRIRIRATWSATTYDIFTGWVTGWPVDVTNNGFDSTVTIQCVDSLAWLNRARVPEDQVYSYADSISGLSLFLRGTDDFAWKDAEGTNNAALVFGQRSQSSSMTPGSASPAINFDGSTLWKVGTTVANYFAGTMSFWIQTSQVPQAATVGIMGNLRKSVPGPAYNNVALALTSNGQLAWTYEITGIVSNSAVTSRAINDGKPHHVCLVLDGTASGFWIYVDGVAQAFDASLYGAAEPAAFGLEVIGNTSIQNPGTYIGSEYFNGSLQDIAMWTTALTAAQVKALYDLSAGFLVEDAATRIARILDAESWPASWRDISTTMRSQCGRLVFAGRTGLDCLQEIERTEQGYFFAAKDGDVTFRSRYWYLEDTRGTTSQATFSDDGAGIGYSGAFGFRYDDLDIRNDIVITANPVGRGRASDLASITDYGAQGLAIDTLLTSSQSAADMAAGLSYKYATPVWRGTQMVVYPANGDTWATVLSLELTDRITQEITPMAVGSQIVKSMLIGRIEWVIGADDGWEFSVLGEPVPADFFVLDSSSLDGSDPLGF
jgi:hypothetical protein